MTDLYAIALPIVSVLFGFALGWIVFSERRFGQVGGISSVEIVVRFTSATTASHPIKALSDIQKTLDDGLQKDDFARPERGQQKSAVFYYEILSVTVDRT